MLNKNDNYFYADNWNDASTYIVKLSRTTVCSYISRSMEFNSWCLFFWDFGDVKWSYRVIDYISTIIIIQPAVYKCFTKSDIVFWYQSVNVISKTFHSFSLLIENTWFQSAHKLLNFLQTVQIVVFLLPYFILVQVP